MKLIAALMIGIFLAAGWSPTLAEDASEDEIVDALKPKVKTRKPGGSPGLSESDQAFITGLRKKTRSIRGLERAQLATIVEEKKLPSIDLDIFFDYNSAEIADEAKPGLIELGNALRSDVLKNAVLMLGGHTDAVGSGDYNQALSERRAESIKSYLVDIFVIEPDRLIAVGYGEEQLKNTADPEAAENRRVTVVNLAN